MIITCPACDTRFLLSAQAVGAQGRDVRCAKCGHQWHAMPQQAEAEELVLELSEDFEDTELPDEQPALPEEPPFVETEVDEAMLAALTAPKPKNNKTSPWNGPGWKVAVAASGFVALMLALLVLREPLQKPLAPFYAMLGYTAEEGIMLADMALKELPSRHKKRYELQCNIINQAKEDRVIPRLKMQIINAGGEVVAEDGNFLSETGRILQPGKSIACKNLRFENPSNSADRLVIDLGSTLELKLRADWKEPSAEAAASDAEENNEEEEATDG